MAISDVVIWLVDKGFFQFFAPFALTFVIVYGVLIKTKIFGDDKDKKTALDIIYAVIAFVSALFVLLFGLNVYIEMFLAWVLGRMGILLILVLAGFVIYAFAKGGLDSGGK
jgi:hypothetical protein